MALKEYAVKSLLGGNDEMNKMKDKITHIFIVTLVFLLPMSSFAEENYHSNSNVGFYGQYIPLPEENEDTHIKEQEYVPERPLKEVVGTGSNSTIIPRLGDTTNLFVRNVVALMLVSALFYEIKKLKIN